MVYNATGCVMMETYLDGIPDLPTEMKQFPPGKEDDPDYLAIDKHVTLKYGLIRELVSKEDIEDVLGPKDFYQGFEINFNNPRIEVFGGDDELKAIVIAFEDLFFNNLNLDLSRLPHIDSFPVYVPHITMGYVAVEEVGKAVRMLTPYLPTISARLGSIQITGLD